MPDTVGSCRLSALSTVLTAPALFCQRCFGPVCGRPSASRPVPFRQNCLQRRWRRTGRNSVDGCGEDRALLDLVAALCADSGMLADRMDLRYFLCGGMTLSALFTALFGLAYTWQIHSLAYFISIQVRNSIRPCLLASLGGSSELSC